MSRFLLAAPLLLAGWAAQAQMADPPAAPPPAPPVEVPLPPAVPGVEVPPTAPPVAPPATPSPVESPTGRVTGPPASPGQVLPGAVPPGTPAATFLGNGLPPPPPAPASYPPCSATVRDQQDGTERIKKCLRCHERRRHEVWPGGSEGIRSGRGKNHGPQRRFRHGSQKRDESGAVRWRTGATSRRGKLERIRCSRGLSSPHHSRGTNHAERRNRKADECHEQGPVRQ